MSAIQLFVDIHLCLLQNLQKKSIFKLFFSIMGNTQGRLQVSSDLWTRSVSVFSVLPLFP